MTSQHHNYPALSHHIFNLKTVSLLLVVAGILFSARAPAAAQTFTWTNATAGVQAWSAAANWSPNGAPASGGNSAYVLNFNAPGANTTVTDDLAGVFVLNGITFSAGNVTLAGNQLEFANNGTAAPSLNNSLTLPPTLNNDIALDTDTTFNGTSGYILNGVISGQGGIVNNVNGWTTLSGTNTYTGPTTMAAGPGTLQVVGSSPLGNTSGLTQNGGGLVLANATVSAPITVDGGYFRWSAPGAIDTLAGPITIAAGYTLNVNSVGGTSSGATLHFTGGITSAGGHLEIFDDNSGNSDPGNVWIENNPMNLGTGELRGFGSHINVAGNVVGTIHPYYGRRMSLEVDDAFSGAPAVFVGGNANGGSGSVGKLDLNGHGLLVSSLTDNADSGNEVTSDGNATLTVSNSSPSTYVGLLSGAGLALVKDGPGTLTLAGNNTYGGDTTVQGGTLYLRSGATTGFGGALLVTAGATLAGAGSSAEDITLGQGGSLLADGGVGSQSMECPGNLNLGINTTDITTNNVDVFHGGKILVAGGLSLTGTNVFSILSVPEGLGTFDLIGYGSFSGNGLFVLGKLPAGITAHLNNSGTAIQLVITGSSVESDIWVGNATGNWDLTGTLDWKGSLSGTAMGYRDTDGVVFNDSATNFSVTLLSAVSPTAVTVNNATHAYTFLGVGGISGAASLTKSGTGMLTLATLNTYLGVTTLDQGVLQMGSANALPTAGAMVVNGGVLDFNDLSQTINTLSGAGGVLTNTGQNAPILTLGNGNGSAAYSGLIAGSLGLAKVGAGTMIISGTNTYTGATTVGAGTLMVNDLAPLGFSTNVGLGSGLLVLSNATVSVPIIASNIYGSNVKWTGPNAIDIISGAITISNGLLLNINSAAGTSAGAELHITGGVNSSGGNLEIFDDNSGSSDPGNVWIETTPINLGTGELRGFGSHINVANNVVGAIHPYYGRRMSLEVDQAFAGAPALTVGNPSWGKLDLNGHDLLVSSLTDSGDSGDTVTSDRNATLIVSNNVPDTYGGLLAGNGLSLLKTGTGRLVLGAYHTYAGNTTVAGGVLEIDGTIGSGSGQVLVSNGTLSGVGTILDAVTVEAGSTLSPGAAGAGTLTIDNSLVLAGTTAVAVGKSGTTITASGVQGVTDLTYGGALNVSVSGPTALAVGDTIKLFDATSYSGVFAAVSPAPGFGLAWDQSSLAVDGTLKVVASPVNTAPTNLTWSASAGSLTLSWPLDHLGWRLLAQTNNLQSGVSRNPLDWAMVPGSDQTNLVSVPLSPGKPSEFYRLVYP